MADGLYPKAGINDEKMALLVLIGVKSNGEGEILSKKEGYRESHKSLKETFEDLKIIGFETIGMLIADRIRGLWKSFSEIYPKVK